MGKVSLSQHPGNHNFHATPFLLILESQAARVGKDGPQRNTALWVEEFPKMGIGPGAIAHQATSNNSSMKGISGLANWTSSEVISFQMYLQSCCKLTHWRLKENDSEFLQENNRYSIAKITLKIIKMRSCWSLKYEKQKSNNF